MEENNESSTPIKKPRSEKQQAAFAKALEVKKERVKARKNKEELLLAKENLMSKLREIDF